VERDGVDTLIFYAALPSPECPRSPSSVPSPECDIKISLNVSNKWNLKGDNGILALALKLELPSKNEEGTRV
jgi:hypothetical protein